MCAQLMFGSLVMKFGACLFLLVLLPNQYRSKEVTKIGDGKFTVKWEDPDGGPEESEVDPKAPHQSGGQEFST